MVEHTMRCLSSSLFPWNCSDMTATSKLAPQLWVQDWSTQRLLSKDHCKRVFGGMSACTEHASKHDRGGQKELPPRCVDDCLHAEIDEGSEEGRRV